MEARWSMGQRVVQAEGTASQRLRGGLGAVGTCRQRQGGRMGRGDRGKHQGYNRI